MSDDKKTGQPSARSLEGVLDELRLALSSPVPAAETPIVTPVPAEEPAAAPLNLAPPVDPSPAVPPVAFEIVTPVDAPAAEAPVVTPAAPAVPVPPIPTAIESAPESWTLMTDAQPATVPEPTVSAPAAPAPAADDAARMPAPVDPPASPLFQTDGALSQDLPEASAAAAPTFAVPDAMPFAPEPAVPEPPAAISIPIPATIETREAPEVEPADLNDLEHAAEVRPDGLVQIACLFPEGGEKIGQSFVNRLKETAARLKKPIVVQPVFLHTWSADAVDIAAWAKSAALSGADVVFVIAPRAQAPLFAKLAAAAAGAGTTGRMIASELVSSAALYADVLVDLKRKANGPR